MAAITEATGRLLVRRRQEKKVDGIESCSIEKGKGPWQNEEKLTSKQVERPISALQKVPRQQTNDVLQ